MYAKFFKLSELPFRLTADPRFHFISSGREAVRLLLRTELFEAEGCLILSGDSGVGKTILVEDMLGELSEQFVIVRIRNPDCSISEFYQAVVAQLDERTPPTVRSVLLANFDTCLARLAAQRRNVVLLIDNGESMSQDLLEEVFRLPTRRAGGSRNLRVLVTARSGIEKTLNQGRINGRSAIPKMKVRLTALSAEDTQRYVEHRLKVAGARADIFSPDAFAEFHRFSGGVPRLINTLADGALMLAFNRSREMVGAAEVRSAADQLNWAEVQARPENAEGAEPVSSEADWTALPSQIGHLRLELAGSVVAELDLSVGKISIGRARTNDICLDSQFISRHHCQILTTAQYSVIEDLQSQNGIVIGSRRVSVHRLVAGDRIALGEHHLTYSKSEISSPTGEAVSPVRTLAGPADLDMVATRIMNRSALCNVPESQPE